MGIFPLSFRWQKGVKSKSARVNGLLTSHPGFVIKKRHDSVLCFAVNVHLKVFSPLFIATLCQRSALCAFKAEKVAFPPLAISPSAGPPLGNPLSPSMDCGSYCIGPQFLFKFPPLDEQRKALLGGISI